jgi:hypothetical protein
MVDATLLVAWRAWYARNEITHDKALPSISASKGFLCSYLKLLHDIKDNSSMDLIMGKKMVVQSGWRPKTSSPKKGPDKTWTRPLPDGLNY